MVIRDHIQKTNSLEIPVVAPTGNQLFKYVRKKQTIVDFQHVYRVELNTSAKHSQVEISN